MRRCPEANHYIKRDVEKILAELKPREQEVILLRFGLVDGEEWTLGAIGKKLKLSRERVRQLQNRGLRVLKTKNLGDLKDYLVG